MEQSLIEKSLPSVVTEPVITVEEPYNVEFQFTLQSKTNISLKQTLTTMLGNRLHGMGKVDLISITAVYRCTAANEFVNMGIANANSDLTSVQVAMTPGGHSFASNAFNYGSQVSVDLLIPDVLSRQLQPPSSHLPSFKLYLSCSKDVHIVLIVRLKHYGPRIEREVFVL